MTHMQPTTLVKYYSSYCDFFPVERLLRLLNVATAKARERERTVSYRVDIGMIGQS